MTKDTKIDENHCDVGGCGCNVNYMILGVAVIVIVMLLAFTIK
jgi:hypothetical protein